MGLIQAFTGALSGTFADQWVDFIMPPQNMTATTALVAGVTKGTNNGRGSNTHGSENIITDGSKIVVPEGMGLLIIKEGAIVDFSTEAGGYTYSIPSSASSSIMNGDGLSSIFNQTKDRFKAGGQPLEQHLAFYVNLKEIPNNRFGTQTEIYWDDAFLGTQVGAMARGIYSLKITNPEAFVRGFVPPSYLIAGAKPFDFDDMDNDAASQMFGEVVGSLSSAFSIYTNDPDKGNRITKIQGDQIGFAKSLCQAVEENYSWVSGRGIEIVSVAMQAIEYDEDTKALLKDVKRADALAGARGNSFMQQSVARGLQAAGENSDGGTGMAFMGMGAGVAGGMMQGLQQPVMQPYQQPQMQPQPVPQQQMAHAPNPSAEDPYETLKKMKDLLDNGIISEEEFNKKKSELLGL